MFRPTNASPDSHIDGNNSVTHNITLHTSTNNNCDLGLLGVV